MSEQGNHHDRNFASLSKADSFGAACKCLDINSTLLTFSEISIYRTNSISMEIQQNQSINSVWQSSITDYPSSGWCPKYDLQVL